VEAHRLAEERSLAYHRAIAERLRTHPEILARARVNTWLSSHDTAPFFARAWATRAAIRKAFQPVSS
jgi:hypothetical protein